MKAMRRKMERVLLLSMLACALITVLSPIIYRLWIGDQVSVPFTMTLMVAIYVSVYCWMNLNGTLVVGMGKIQVETIIVIVGMVLHICYCNESSS